VSMPEHQLDSMTVRRLIGVYNADGTVIGELAYFVGSRLGRTHRSLCDVTHGLLRQKSEWQACRTELPVPFDTFHRNDQPDEVRSATENTAPVVVAQTDLNLILLMGPDALSGCGGSVAGMTTALDAAVIHAGLCWPPAPERR
jgi:hypothetical protein